MAQWVELSVVMMCLCDDFEPAAENNIVLLFFVKLCLGNPAFKKKLNSREVALGSATWI